MSIKYDDSGFDKLRSLLSDLEELNGQSMRNATFPIRIKISKTADSAIKRDSYESYIKNGKGVDKDIADYLENFIGDMWDKHIQ